MPWLSWPRRFAATRWSATIVASALRAPAAQRIAVATARSPLAVLSNPFISRVSLRSRPPATHQSSAGSTPRSKVARLPAAAGSGGWAGVRCSRGSAFSGATGAGVAPGFEYATVYVKAEALVPQVTAISRTMPSAPTVTATARGAAWSQPRRGPRSRTAVPDRPTFLEARLPADQPGRNGAAVDG